MVRNLPWIGVKQKEKAGRPDIDLFETAMRNADRKKGFFVGFDYTDDALHEVQAFFTRERRVIVPLTVRDILDEEIARKPAQGKGVMPVSGGSPRMYV